MIAAETNNCKPRNVGFGVSVRRQWEGSFKMTLTSTRQHRGCFPSRVYAAQFCTFNPLTRRNSFSFLVTTVRPEAMA